MRLGWLNAELVVGRGGGVRDEEFLVARFVKDGFKQQLLIGRIVNDQNAHVESSSGQEREDGGSRSRVEPKEVEQGPGSPPPLDGFSIGGKPGEVKPGSRAAQR